MSNNKNIDNDGKRILPSAYRLKRIAIQNYRGDEKFIENLVVSFSITESLYSPTLIFEASIKDSVNFLESFPLTGQESLNIEITYIEHESDIEKSLDLFFFITEYPTYGRSSKNENLQVYKIKGISEQVYISSQKKISRAYSYQNTSDIIHNLLERDCNLAFSDFAVSGDSISQCRHIFNFQTPMLAIELMRSRTFDIHGAPFYFYQDLSGYYNLISHSSITSDDTNPIYRTYYDARKFAGEAGSELDYEERATRIISCASNLKMAKLDQAKKGAFASQTWALDYTTKTYKGQQYNYVKSDPDNKGKFKWNTRITENALESTPVISTSHVISKGRGQGEAMLAGFNNAHVEYIAKNSGAYLDMHDGEDQTAITINDLANENIHHQNAIRALANTYTHDLVLYGDFNLNPAKKVELKFPKAIDPIDRKDILDDDDIYDKKLSGKYFITSVQHKFEGGEYYSHVRVKRDSMSVVMEGTK